MPNPTEVASLTVDGKVIDNLAGVECNLSYGQVPAVDATFSISEASSGSTAFYAAKKVHCAQKCDLMLAGMPVFKDGLIVKKTMAFQAEAHAVQFEVYDKASVIGQAAVVVPGGQFKGYTFPAIASAVLKPFGLSLDASGLSGDALTPFQRFVVQPGEAALEFLSRAAQARGIGLKSDGKGTIKATTGNGSFPDEGDVLKEGANILAAQASYDISEMWSELTVRGQNFGSDSSYGAVVSQVGAKMTNSSFPFYKPKSLLMENSGTVADARIRANTEKLNSLYHALDVTVTVRGWLRQNGKLWDVGKTVTIESDMLDMQGQLVTNTVSFRQGPEGTTTVLGLKLANSMADDLLAGALNTSNLDVTKGYGDAQGLTPSFHGPH